MNITELNDLEQLIEKLNELLLDENKFYKIILVGKENLKLIF